MNDPLNNLPSTSPLQAFWRWLMAAPLAAGNHQTCPTVRPGDANIGALCIKVPGTPPCASSRPVVQQPLRVLRVLDADLAPWQAGRLRISGRMADVCAELDRLAAHAASFQ